jgi:hypothetical protein
VRINNVTDNDSSHGEFTPCLDDTQVALPAAALWYASELGLPIFPVSPGKNAPPAFVGWQEQATSLPYIVKAWWGTWKPTANIGLLTNGLFVLDVDPRHDGPASLRRLTAYHGPLPITPMARTPRGGWHVYFRGTRPRITVSTGRVGPGLDVRSNTGYCILPPSRRADGCYRWLKGRGPDEIGMAPTPEWLLDLAEPPAPTPPPPGPRPEITDRLAEFAFDAEIATVRQTPDSSGTCNQTLFVAGRKLGRFCANGLLAWTTVRDELIAAAIEAGHPKKLAENTVRSALRSRGARL